MSSPLHQHLASWARLRGGLAVLLLACYVAALGSAPSGHGLRLLSHLAREHALSQHAAPASERGHGVHEHDGGAHTHEAPEPGPTVVATGPLDDHWLSRSPALVPPKPTAAWSGQARGAPASVNVSVETPPPIGRG